MISLVFFINFQTPNLNQACPIPVLGNCFPQYIKFVGEGMQDRSSMGLDQGPLGSLKKLNSFQTGLLGERTFISMKCNHNCSKMLTQDRNGHHTFQILTGLTNYSFKGFEYFCKRHMKKQIQLNLSIKLHLDLND